MYLVSKTQTFAKLFFIVSFSGLFMYLILATYSFHTAYSSMSEIRSYQDHAVVLPQVDIVPADRSDKDLKYILIWTTNNKTKLVEEGQRILIDNDCPRVNCYVTTNKNLLNGDYRNFDAIVFNMSIMDNWKPINLPRKRLLRQKYVFHSMMASNENPVCNVHLDSYFNWTWSYKLYSDIVTPFLEVYDLKGNVVAPDLNVQWLEEYSKFNATKLGEKTKSVALLMVNCKSKVLRKSFVNKMHYYFKEHQISLDVYGCNCIRESCMKGSDKDYYFYLILDDSMSEDYVTSEVLSAYDNGAVPIVIGGADYSKFLPEGSYIEATKSYQEVAAAIAYTIRNPSIYNKYHDWRSKYTVHGVDPHRGFCELCGLLNNEKRIHTHRTYETFRKWWFYGSLKERCYFKGAERFSDVISYMNSTRKRFQGFH